MILINYSVKENHQYLFHSLNKKKNRKLFRKLKNTKCIMIFQMVAGSAATAPIIISKEEKDAIDAKRIIMLLITRESLSICS